MKTTIIYAHPYEKSFNHAILETLEHALCESGVAYMLIDLYADGFDPVMRREELAVYAKGGWKDPLVERYNKVLDETNRLVLIFPIWWYDFPAILKGFFDKVMLAHSAYIEDRGMIPVRNISETLLFTTSSASTEALVSDFGDAVRKVMINATFKAIGFNGAEWHHFGLIGESTPQQRKDFLSRAAERVRASR